MPINGTDTKKERKLIPHSNAPHVITFKLDDERLYKKALTRSRALWCNQSRPMIVVNSMAVECLDNSGGTQPRDPITSMCISSTAATIPHITNRAERLIVVIGDAFVSVRECSFYDS